MADIDHKKMNEWAIAWAGTPKDSSEKYTALCYLDLQAKMEAAEQNERELRRIIERGRNSNATELGLSAQLAEQRSGNVKLLERAEAAEAKLREVEAHADALANALDEMSYDANIALPKAFHDYRALAPERTVAGQADLGSSSEPLAAKATLLDTHERSEFNREDDASSVASCRDEPASPLLPGLERAAEICIREIEYWGFGRQEAGRMAARGCANRCLAEISRLKGEGRGS